MASARRYVPRKSPLRVRVQFGAIVVLSAGLICVMTACGSSQRQSARQAFEAYSSAVESRDTARICDELSGNRSVNVRNIASDGQGSCAEGLSFRRFVAQFSALKAGRWRELCSDTHYIAAYERRNLHKISFDHCMETVPDLGTGFQSINLAQMLAANAVWGVLNSSATVVKVQGDVATVSISRKLPPAMVGMPPEPARYLRKVILYRHDNHWQVGDVVR